MKAASIVPVLVILLLGAATSTSATTIVDLEQSGPVLADPDDYIYEVVDGSEIVLLDAEEDWCNTLEGSAGGWLIADELMVFIDGSNGEPFTVDPATRRLLEAVASEGVTAVDPRELAQIDTFLRFPLASALACRTAFETRDD